MPHRRKNARTSSSPLARLALILGVAAAVVVPAQGAAALPAEQASAVVVAGTPKAHLTKTPKPSVHGSLRPGSVLRVATGTWAPGAVRVHLRWLRDGRPIAGAVHRGYTVRTADQGARLSVRVVGSKPGYRTVSRTSTPRLVVRSVPRVPAIASAPAATQPSASAVPVPMAVPATPVTAATPVAVAAQPSASAAPAPAVVPVTAAPAIASGAPVASTVPTTTAPTTPLPTTSTTGAAITGDGDWIVGKDVQPGVYVTSATTTSCYWKTVSAFDGRFESIRNNDIGSGQRIMEVQAGDSGVSTSRCGTWVRQADAPAVTTIGTGEYLVGQQIRSGTYRTQVPTDGCYWSTVSDFTDSLDSIIENDYIAGPATATVVVPDAAKGFKTSSCGPWTRVD